MSRVQHPAPLFRDATGQWALIQADSLAFLPLLPDASVDAVITDPPYAIGMAGHQWDGGYLRDPDAFQAFTTTWARHIARVLKPGAHAAIFGAPRTCHRLVAGVEDAGLEVRDQLLWLYGSGVPKSRRMPGGRGSSLAPRYEPILLARRSLDPVTKTIAGNMAAHGTGALNIDAARIKRPASEPGEGFWPGNLALSHDPGCKATICTPGCPAPLIDRIAATERAAGSPPFSRLLYAAKATRAEREAGLEQLTRRDVEIFPGSKRRPRANVHPTVKPIGLMRWLVRLIVPPGGLVLDPFTGSGSTGIAAVLEGRQFVGIEREADYIDVARARLQHWTAVALADKRDAT